MGGRRGVIDDPCCFKMFSGFLSLFDFFFLGDVNSKVSSVVVSLEFLVFLFVGFKCFFFFFFFGGGFWGSLKFSFCFLMFLLLFV